ncbi:MAG: Rha family transcriptional regulator [Clostridiales bacterium]|nr:Rha family transcriptional regulator [Clostridiales bacterium]
MATLTNIKSGLSEAFIALNFEESAYKDASGKRNKRYLLTKDGFTMLMFRLRRGESHAI